MLKKMFKYDFFAVFKIWWIVSLCTLSLVLIGSLSVNLFSSSSVQVLSIISFCSSAFSIIGIFASLFGIALFIAYRFYNTMFGDEGYLTYTLPMSRNTLLFAKTLNNCVWNVIISLSFFLYIFIFVSVIDKGYIFNSISNAVSIIRNIFFELGLWSLLYLLLAFVWICASSALSVILIEFCITCGSVLVKKAKFVISVLIYFGIITVLANVSELLFVWASSALDRGDIAFTVSSADSIANLKIALVLLAIIVYEALIAFVFYMSTLTITERKLNI